MTSPSPRCVFCARPGVHRHHWTGRPEPGLPYFDPASTVPVCVPHHHVEHQSWRFLGIDRASDPVEARIARGCWLFGRLADLGRPVTLDTDTLRGIHRVFLALADDLRERGAL